MSSLNLKQEFEKWKKENNQFGRQAFSRFIMLKFLDALQKSSKDFVFKGGNLLWHYIDTPIETIDLDLATLTIESHDEVRSHLNNCLTLYDEIEFSIKLFKEIVKEDQICANVIIEFKTVQGQKNQFPIDIVYSLPTDLAKVKSTVSTHTYEAASIENIIVDKLAAAHQFGSGNTRMKDFDDLWRISKSEYKVDSMKLQKLLKQRGVPFELKSSWQEHLGDNWKRHAKNYKDITKDFKIVLDGVNEYLLRLIKIRD